MRLPLLIGARPQHSSKGPVVSLEAGKWGIVHHNLVDSVLAIILNDAPPALLGKEPTYVVSDGDARIQIVFEKRGGEAFVSAFAERLGA